LWTLSQSNGLRPAIAPLGGGASSSAGAAPRPIIVVSAPRAARGTFLFSGPRSAAPAPAGPPPPLFLPSRTPGMTQPPSGLRFLGKTKFVFSSAAAWLFQNFFPVAGARKNRGQQEEACQGEAFWGGGRQTIFCSPARRGPCFRFGCRAGACFRQRQCPCLGRRCPPPPARAGAAKTIRGFGAASGSLRQPSRDTRRGLLCQAPGAQAPKSSGACPRARAGPRRGGPARRRRPSRPNAPGEKAPQAGNARGVSLGPNPPARGSWPPPTQPL
jgi:hypothetical protein